jgi:RNA polymerase sigma-70 factor (ECF subfamily)
MPPEPGITVGRDAMIRLWAEGGFGSAALGPIQCVITRANRQPAIANYVRRPGHTAFRAMALDVLRIENGLISEIIAFHPTVFEDFGLPATL